jgi:hypothetical protein
MMADALPDPRRHADPMADEEQIEKATKEQILTILHSYWDEADQARRGGSNPRDTIWQANWDRYWGRYDFSNKADWQSKHVMPEVSQFVDRWAAAMREALIQGGRWYSVEDETGQNNELSKHIERFMDVLLSRCTLTPDGHETDFEGFFEDQVKLGSLMTMCAAVTWKDGWVRVESVDPREHWLDPEMRNLYRIRQYTIDRHRLDAMRDMMDAEGEPIYDLEALDSLGAEWDELHRAERERTTGHAAAGGESNRKPIVLREYLCDIVTSDGEVVAENALVVEANQKHIIRGPEPNPFWHERDWLVSSPMITVPFSVYGRSYAEDWAEAADAFVELTNLILDGVFTTTMKAYTANPAMFDDPSELDEGISPNKLYRLAEEVMDGRRAINEVDFGTLPAEAFQTWQALKNEQREGAKQNEIALGQIPQKGGITATEVNQTQASSFGMIRSMARTIESRFLEPILTLVFQTALQHMDFNDPHIQHELGEETARMLQMRREEFAERRMRFRVRGISSLVDRQAKLRSMLSMLQVIGSNEMLMGTFMQRTSPDRLMDYLVKLFGVDPLEFEKTERERMMEQVMQAQQRQGQPGDENAPAPDMLQNMMGGGAPQ